MSIVVTSVRSASSGATSRSFRHASGRYAGVGARCRTLPSTHPISAPCDAAGQSAIHASRPPSKVNTSDHIESMPPSTYSVKAVPQSRHSACSARTSRCHAASDGSAPAQSPPGQMRGWYAHEARAPDGSAHSSADASTIATRYVDAGRDERRGGRGMAERRGRVCASEEAKGAFGSDERRRSVAG